MLVSAVVDPSAFDDNRLHVSFGMIGRIDLFIVVCREGESITLSTLTELMRESQMKEKEFENYTDPILEECYRMKEEFNAKFDSLEELTAHLIQVQEECRRNGMKVVSYYVPPSERTKELALTDAETLDEVSQQ